MATREPKDKLPGEDTLVRTWRRGAKEMPPPNLDAAVLAQARRAVAPRASVRRWAIPVSVAAVLVLSVSVVLQVSRQETPMLDELASVTEKPVAQTPAEKKSYAAPTAPASIPEATRTNGVPAKRAEQEAPHAAAPMSPQRAKSESAPAPLAKEHRAAASAVNDAAAPTADVIAVSVGGAPGAYEFTVTVRSTDTGCAQYADWWEVVSDDGDLLYRRTLLHSHANEQPFARNGGPVPIQPETLVWVRAHMNNGGYNGAALKGSVKTGFVRTIPTPDFAAGLARQPPLPTGCDF